MSEWLQTAAGEAWLDGPAGARWLGTGEGAAWRGEEQEVGRAEEPGGAVWGGAWAGERMLAAVAVG